MIRKFKIGDRVKVIRQPKFCAGCSEGEKCIFLGRIGIVADNCYRDVEQKGVYVYVWPFLDIKYGECEGCSGFIESDLELVKKEIKEFGIVKFCRGIYK